jgi:dynein heavy chain
LQIEGGGSAGAGGSDEQTLQIIADFKTRAPAEFSMLDITAKIKDAKDKTPYVVVCLQECERMNGLLSEIKRSLEDLRLGLTGALNITDAMESLQRSLSFNKVPGSWEAAAYPSRKNLAMWFNELLERCHQLEKWSSELETPLSLCISYLFNPMSFLTAIMQTTSREKILPLDNMSLETRVTLLKSAEEVHGYPESGAYIHGLVL